MVVSLVLPFELSSINYKIAGLKDIAKAEIAIDFYQGFKMGLDSVANNLGGNFKLQVYDSKDDPANIAILAAKAGIKNSDLIIGPIFPNGIKAFATYSKNMQKLMVSPLAAASPDQFNNPYLITVNNSLEQHTLSAINFIKSDLKPKKIIMIRSGQADEFKFAVPFKKYRDSLLKQTTFSEIGIKAIGYENVYKHLNPVGLNVVVLPATDRNFLLSITKELLKLSANFQIAVIGHPGWEKLQFLDAATMQKLNTHITSSYKVDYKTPRVEQFLGKYRAKFSLEPSEYAIKGFDIAYYFASLMSKKGKAFADDLTKTSLEGIHNQLDFVKHPKLGYYNNSLMILKYQDFQLKKVK
jgi:ABC-type branched-subunit amino acid transport system substrate-binding protein